MNKLKNAWSRVWNWTVSGWNKMWEVLLRHSACVYTALGLLIIFLGYILYSEMKHTAEVIELKRDAIVLIGEIDEQNNLIVGQQNLIEVQSDLIEKQRSNILEHKKVIELQEGIIKQLIDYLKSIDEWPPSRPVDPNSIAI